MKLTQSNVDRFKLPAGKVEAIIFDDDMPGFGLRVREGGSRNWIVQYKIGPKHRRLTIGTTATLTAGKAREAAGTALAKVKLGNDPAHEKAIAQSAAGETFAAVAERFLKRQSTTVRAATYEATHRYLMVRCKPLHGLPLAKINRATIAARLSALAEDPNIGPVSADRCRAALSAMFAWAIREGLADANPVVGTNTFSDNEARERVLTDAELAAIWNGAPEGGYGNIVRLLMLTGCRRDEIASLRWSEIDLEADGGALISLPSERTKNGRPHDVPLSDAAVTILEGIKRRGERELVFGEGDGGFSGWSKAKTALDIKLGKAVKPWRLHDLRRTASTRMADSGVLPHVIEAVINHVSGHKAGVAGIYNRATYAAEKRAALDTLASYIKTAAAKASGANVTTLPRRA